MCQLLVSPIVAPFGQHQESPPESDGKSVNRGLPVWDLVRGQGQRPPFLVLTKRSVASGDENGCHQFKDARRAFTNLFASSSINIGFALKLLRITD